MTKVMVLKGMFGKAKKVVSIRQINSVIAKRAALAALSGTKSKLLKRSLRRECAVALPHAKDVTEP